MQNKLTKIKSELKSTISQETKIKDSFTSYPKGVDVRI
jgi:hypothetical protein